MTNEKLYTLIQRLINSTERRKINWEATARENTFATYLSDYSVIIHQDDNDYTLAIIDQAGDTIEQIDDVELGQEFRDSLSQMTTLFSIARRNARGTDKAIDDILNSLD